MRLVHLTIFLLLCTSVNAEFLSTRSAVMNFTLDSYITLDGVEGSVNAQVAFFPKKLQTQGVEKPTVESTHPVEVQQNDQEALHLLWKEVDGLRRDRANDGARARAGLGRRGLLAIRRERVDHVQAWNLGRGRAARGCACRLRGQPRPRPRIHLVVHLLHRGGDW